MADTNLAAKPVIDAAAFKQLVDLGIALSAERDHDRLLERIVLGAKEITNSDGGTLYLRTEDNRLSFQILRNDTLKTAMGGTTGVPIKFPPLRMYREDDGQPNHNNVATHVALTGEIVNIADAYDTGHFDFSGTKKFDENTGYRSKSFLTVPLKNHQEEVIGVIQLINARVADSDTVIAFHETLVPLVEALASQAAVALDNQRLILEQRALFDAFMRMMAGAIDAKSPYTGGHCQRVPALTEMIAEAACNATTGQFADFALNEDEWYELQIAGGLHDVGKVTTPVHIMDKATKLEKICDRIEEVRVRFELLRRDAAVFRLGALLDGANKAEVDAEYAARLKEIDDDFAFVAEANIGGEFMADDKIARIEAIGRQRYILEGEEMPLLTEDEIMNLSIRRGTLNDADRKIINDHIVLTIQMLESLPFPSSLKRVPEIAGGHHEKMDGTGYPKGLKRHEMSTLARMMGIADIFEALTAADRPYKKAKTMSESMKIMVGMVKGQHIDPDIFRLFLESGVHQRYAEKFLLPEQIDEIDVGAILAELFPERQKASA
jgi:HD-GYP domain-containing protein (c-di-GMP phosphodiesterase class II)